MIKLTHYDDGKEKYQSHEIRILNDDDSINYNLSGEISGYGYTKNEAIQDFLNKMDNLCREYEMLKQRILVYQDTDIIEVDYRNKPINKQV